MISGSELQLTSQINYKRPDYANELNITQNSISQANTTANSSVAGKTSLNENKGSGVAITISESGRFNSIQQSHKMLQQISTLETKSREKDNSLVERADIQNEINNLRTGIQQLFVSTDKKSVEDSVTNIISHANQAILSQANISTEVVAALSE